MRYKNVRTGGDIEKLYSLKEKLFGMISEHPRATTAVLGFAVATFAMTIITTILANTQEASALMYPTWLWHSCKYYHNCH